MIKGLFNWFRNLFNKEKLYESKLVDDVPYKLNNKTIYIIENEGYRWKAVMVCPCGCNKILHMNLIKEYHPSWKVEIDEKNIITLHPSINRMVGCKSHFFIRRGEVVWA